MKILGFEITRARNGAATALVERQVPTPLSPITSGWNTSRGWYNLFVGEPFTGAWQRNMELRPDTILSYGAVYACVTLIASDIGKLRIKLVEQDANGIWSEVARNSPYWPVLRKPNSYQNRIKFVEQWILSKLIHGNTYVLKERDNRGIVTALHVLDPTRVKVLQAPSGDIYYELDRDDLAGVVREDGRVSVPASEIIHDLMNALFHPLVGLSPIYASGMAAAQGLNIIRNSTAFFGNAARPSGILTAPGHIGDDTAARLKADWEQRFTGDNTGRVAIAGDGLEFKTITMTAVDAQLIEQLKWSAETVCTTFHVPAYMVGVGQMPNYNNIEALNSQYYTQCLQSLIESLELCLDEGLGLDQVPTAVYGAELDLDGLLRMDTQTQYGTINTGIGGGFLTPNEGRKKLDLKAVEGGDTTYMQQQNYALSALAARDRENPLSPQKQPQTPSPLPDDDDEDDDLDAQATAQYAAWELKRMLAA